MSFERVTRAEPCRICKKPDYCARLSRYHLCMRVPSDKPAAKGGWLHPKGSESATAKIPERPKRRGDSELRAQWEPIALQAAKDGESRLPDLAREIGVDLKCLRMLQVGYSEIGKPAWTFPERNHRGWIIGLKRRFVGWGRQVYMTGSRPGLTFCQDWHTRPGAIWIVEGASDVAAGLTLGLCVVGRPSNTGGVEQLAKLLIPHKRRPIVVLGENDRKSAEHVLEKNPHHDPKCRCCLLCFPGRAGAMQSSLALAKRMQATVRWIMPPNGFKDLRDYVRSLKEEDRDGQALRKGRFPTSCPSRMSKDSVRAGVECQADGR